MAKAQVYPKKFDLDHQITFPCERVGYGKGAMLTYSAIVERETI